MIINISNICKCVVDLTWDRYAYESVLINIHN